MSSVMMPKALKPGSPWVLASGLLILLLILASLQYRWLNAVREADRKKTREVLQTALDRFAQDFDQELTRAFLWLQPPSVFRPEDPRDFAQKYERWRSYAPFPDLVREVFIARHGDGEDLELSRFDLASGNFEPAVWPAELDPIRQRLESGVGRRWDHSPERGRRGGRPPHEGRSPPDFDLSLLVDEVPALVMPMFISPPGPGRHPGPPAFGTQDYVVQWLDLSTITEEILPRLTRQHLSLGDGTDYDVRIYAQEGQRPIFSSNGWADAGQADANHGDASSLLFSLLPAEKLHALGRDGSEPRSSETTSSETSGRPTRRDGRRFGESRRMQRVYHFLRQAGGARWRAEASHPSGSLDTAITRAHRNNLVVSFGILLLLGASLLLILLSTRRQQALAKQQLEFTASVSHELLTPLAAMRSAGQNLADGVVTEPPQVQRYGRLIEDEGRRLSNMVGQVLEFAGMQAGRREYSPRPTALSRIVDSALAEYQPVLDEQGFAIETRLEDDLPAVLADPGALRRALQNLIANAVKYGAEGSWIGIEARQADSATGPELQLSVADRGSGIAAADLPRLFEPFFRGRQGADDQIPGSGLGLSLVQHIAQGHGGRVSVTTAPGQGSTFTLHLPMALGDPQGTPDER